MRVEKRTSIVSWKIAAGIVAIVLAKDLPELKYLPPDMCIEVEAAQSIAVREAQCPTFYLLNLENGQVLPMTFDGAASYEVAEIINEGIRRGNRALLRVPDAR